MLRKIAGIIISVLLVSLTMTLIVSISMNFTITNGLVVYI